MSKKFIAVFCGIVLIGLGLIIMLLFIRAPKIKDFKINEYNRYIDEFQSDKVLGPIDNAKTAKEKAESVWIEMFGESIKQEKPYKVFFDKSNDVWLVTGSMHRSLFGEVKGGVANIIIKKSDGKVLAVWHDK